MELTVEGDFEWGWVVVVLFRCVVLWFWCVGVWVHVVVGEWADGWVCLMYLVWQAEKPAVCTFETSPCVPRTRPQV